MNIVFLAQFFKHLSSVSSTKTTVTNDRAFSVQQIIFSDDIPSCFHIVHGMLIHSYNARMLKRRLLLPVLCLYQSIEEASDTLQFIELSR
jgi:hypothetical protein